MRARAWSAVRAPPERRGAGRRVGPLTVLTGCALVGASGCSLDPRGDRVDYGFEPPVLQAAIFHTGDHLALPRGLRLVEGDLVIIDLGGDRNLHVVDATTGARKASVGPVGEGPGEFRTPVAVALDAAGRLWVFDGTNQRATRIELRGTSGDSEWLAETLPLAPGTAIIDAVWTRENTILGEGLFGEHRFGVIGRSGELLGLVGDLVLKGAEQPYTRILHSTHVAVNRELDRVVTAGRWYPRVEIRSPDGELLHVADVPVHSEPELIASRDGLVPTGASLNAYGDVAASADYIYALYCGRTDDRHGVYQHFGRDVHVFDWEGELVTVFRLDRDALAIEVDEANERLFTVEHDPVPAILEYRLPAALRERLGALEMAGIGRSEAGAGAIRASDGGSAGRPAAR